MNVVAIPDLHLEIIGELTYLFIRHTNSFYIKLYQIICVTLCAVKMLKLPVKK